MIFLMRHGEDDNTRLGGWSDAGLSPVGIEQAKRACEKIIDGNYNIKYIFSSDLPRAKQTADIIAERLGVGVVPMKEFRETNNGDLAGISKDRFKAEYPGMYYSSLEWEERYPNGESPKTFCERIETAWGIFKDNADKLNGNSLLVTHGGVIDVIICVENGIAYTNKNASHRIGHAEIVCV